MFPNTKFWYLKHFSIFDGLDEEFGSTVDQVTAMQTYRKHEFIKLPGQHTGVLFFLKKGYAKISRLLEDGQENIIDIVGPGELIGLLGMFDPSENENEIAQALDDVLICNIPKTDFERLLHKYPHLNFQVTKRIGFRLRKIEQRMCDLIGKDVRKRIASFLYRFAEEFGRKQGPQVLVKPWLSHQDIALLTGCTRQTVTAALNEFRLSEIIDFSRSGYIILSMNRLRDASV